VVASVDRTRDPLPQLPIAGARRAEQQHKADWIGIIALAAGLAAPLLEMPSLTDDPWRYPWLLLYYAVSFILCGPRADYLPAACSFNDDRSRWNI
jgi:hypothetical protein